MTLISASDLTRRLQSSPVMAAAKIATSYRSGWRSATIAEVAENLSTGTTPPSTEPRYYDGEINWFTPADIGGYRWLSSASKTITRDAVSDKKARLFERETLLIVCIGGGLSRIGLAPMQCSANQQITGVKFRDDIDPEFAYYSLFARWDELKNAASTATLPILNQAKLGRLEFFFPPIDEQRQIAQFLIWCENRFQQNISNGLDQYPPIPRYLKSMPQTVARIEELVAKVEEARGLRSKALNQVGNFVANLHLHLAESRIIQLDEILVLDEEREPVASGKQYPQVGVKGFGGGLFIRETLDATQTTYKAFNRLYEGAIVLSQVKGWEGAIAGCPGSLAGKFVSPEYRTFRCIPEQAIPEYMAALVVTPWFWTQLQHLTRGLGDRRERTRPEQFLRIEIPMPTIDQQKKALEAFSKLEVVKHLQSQTAAELDALLPSILNKAFKGEL